MRYLLLAGAAALALGAGARSARAQAV